MSLGHVDLTALVEYTRVAMSTTIMHIRNIHGTYPPHGAIQRSYIVCTYPIATGGGHVSWTYITWALLVGKIFLTSRLNSGVWGICRGHFVFRHSYWAIVSLGLLADLFHDHELLSCYRLFLLQYAFTEHVECRYLFVMTTRMCMIIVRFIDFSWQSE